MARLFGALANAGAQMRERQFQREQYDAQQEAARRAEQQRVFEFAATQERLKEQAQLQAQLRRDQLAQQEEQRTLNMIQQGYQPWEGAGVDPMAGDQPFETDVRGVKIAAKRVPNQQVEIGGKRYFRNAQRDENAAAQKTAADLMAKFTLEQEKMQGREDLARLAASLRPPPQAGSGTDRLPSEASTKEIATLSDLAANAKAALDQIATARKSGGTMGGPAAWLGRNVRRYTGQNPSEADVAAANTQKVLAQIRNKLLGASQTTTELQSTKEFLPMLESSNDAFIEEALRAIGRDASQAAQRRMQIMQASGRNVSGLASYTAGLPSFEKDVAGVPATQRPDATRVPPGAPIPNRVPVPWETKK